MFQDGSKVFPPQVSTPPTPFADRETLEKELKALEQDLGDLRSLTNPSWLDHDVLANYSDSNTTGQSHSSLRFFVHLDSFISDFCIIIRVPPNSDSTVFKMN